MMFGRVLFAFVWCVLYVVCGSLFVVCGLFCAVFFGVRCLQCVVVCCLMFVVCSLFVSCWCL